jgi:hypothetical protein
MGNLQFDGAQKKKERKEFQFEIDFLTCFGGIILHELLR